MDIPIALFGIFIGIASLFLVFGLSKRIGVAVFVSGIFIFSISIMTDNIVLGSRIDNIVATESTFNITGSLTQIPDYSYNVITGTSVFTIRADGSNAHTRGMFIGASSVLIGEQVECITVPLQRTGSPTGTADIGIFDANNAKTYEFGDIDVSTITTTITYYTFCPSIDDPDVPVYVIQSGDRIGIKWVSGTSDASNNIMTIWTSTDVFDGTNTIATSYTTTWNSFNTNDINAQLFTLEDVPNNVQVSGIGGIYTYESDDIAFTEMTKILFALTGIMLMLVGVLYSREL